MRFWKGPGNPWSYEPRTRVAEICIPATRDEHIFIQHHILNAPTETYRRDPTVQAWIEQLPTVAYDFTNNSVTFRRLTLINQSQDYLRGNACMDFGGDIFLETGYY